MRSTLLSLIQGIEPFDATEAEHLTQAAAWVESEAPLCRTAKPAVPPQHLVSYFSVVDLEAGEMLLVDHKAAGLWLPAGGHVEPGEHPTDTVRRELREELGLEADFLVPGPLFLTVNRVDDRQGGHWDVSLWYALRGSKSAALAFDPGEFHGVQWFPWSALPIDRSDPELARFAAKLSRRLETFPQ
ncbi:MAG TPA: NUDIX domain-containing protein [Myxococcaceae bacterium]|nr:NUDIX domain-containing protein [Myxococcaceae bacterium]